MLVRTIARPLLASIFIIQGADAVRDPSGRAAAASGFAQQYGSYLPETARGFLESDPDNAVRANGVVHAGGGLMLATGRCPRTASTVLAASLVPTTLAGHPFWDETDPSQRKNQRIQFLKNLGLTGGLLLAAVDTEGKPSLSRRSREAARSARNDVGAALPAPGGKRSPRRCDTARKRGGDAAESVAHRGTDLTEAARRLGYDWAGTAGHRGAEWAGIAGRRGTELAELAGRRGTEFVDRVQAETPELKKRARKAQKKTQKRARRYQKRAGEAASHAVDLAR